MRITGPSRTEIDQVGDDFSDLVMAAVRQAVTVASKDLKATTTVDDLGVIRRVFDQVAKDTLLPALAKQYEKAAIDQRSKVLDAAVTAAITLPTPATTLAEQYLETASNRLAGISDTVWENARGELVAGMQAGESIPQLRKRIMAATGASKARAEMIARTEVNGAQNRGSLEQMKAAGYGGMKEWLATPDDRTRETHKAVNGKEVPLEDQFQVGASLMDGPHDPSGPPGETINCRCTLTYTIPDEPLQEAAVELDEAVFDDLTDYWNQIGDLPVRDMKLDAARRQQEFAAKSPTHARLVEAVKGWTGGGNQMDLIRQTDNVTGQALREILQNAPSVPKPIYRGMYPQSEEAGNWISSLKAGDEIPLDTAASFTENEQHAKRFMGQELDPEEAKEYGIPTRGLPFLNWTGLKMRLLNGRGLPVAGISNSPSEREWLVGRTLRVIRAEKVGVDAWEVDVETI